MLQPRDFITTEASSLVCKFNKYLYCLKHTPRAWYEKIDTYLLKNSFKRCKYDPNMFAKNFDDDVLVVVLYMDDIILNGNQLTFI